MDNHKPLSRIAAVETAIPAVRGVPGFRAAGIHCGLRKDGGPDFALIAADGPCATGGVFTTNEIKAAPVLVNMERLGAHADSIRAVAINTVSANACTGPQGIANAREMARLVAARLGCEAEQVLVLSTGVIGTQLPMDRIARGAELATAFLGGGGDHWEQAACAIMTTDTRPKLAAASGTAAGRSYTIAGISKGAGMIAPNMATMLGIIVTDARLDTAQAQRCIKAAADRSFNRIVVDGDMSTNDTVLLLANGHSGVAPESPEEWAGFQAALEAVCTRLAQEIVRDGEGVTKFVTVQVTGAGDDHDARRIANTIATSALVKTAFYGHDANWGRIIAAAGRAGVPLEADRLRLTIAAGGDELLLVTGGAPTDYREADATRIFRQPEATVMLDCGLADGVAEVWTCDLSHEYVTINGDYRT
jgi:glutamate N-acetyltransferase / amino-acid N-acetyltransferase